MRTLETPAMVKERELVQKLNGLIEWGDSLIFQLQDMEARVLQALNSDINLTKRAHMKKELGYARTQQRDVEAEQARLRKARNETVRTYMTGNLFGVVFAAAGWASGTMLLSQLIWRML